MKLSVIIPVYNAEKYLNTCVESILAQDFSDYEIILVNDGSKDKSAEICDSLAINYSQISVYHKENGGVSSARNLGIDRAQGEYLMFVDSDDFIGEGMIADLMGEAESKNVDYVLCGIEDKCSDGNNRVHIADLPARELFNRDYVVNRIIFDGCADYSYLRYPYVNSACASIYKRKIIVSNNIRFEKRPMGEDWLFNMHYLEYAESAVYIDVPYYKYLKNDASAMYRYQPLQFELWLENRAYRKELISKYNLDVNQIATDRSWVLKTMYYCLEVVKHDCDYRNKLRGIFVNEEFKFAIKRTKSISPKYFLPVLFLLKVGMNNEAVNLLRLYKRLM